MIRSSIVFGAAVAAVVVAILAPTPTHAAEWGSYKRAPGYSSVEPIIKANCVVCHNSDRHPGKVDVSSYKALMASGDKKKTVVPGHPEASNLVLFVDGSHSPRMPMGKPPLKAAEISALKAWVKAGAKP